MSDKLNTTIEEKLRVALRAAPGKQIDVSHAVVKRLRSEGWGNPRARASAKHRMSRPLLRWIGTAALIVLISVLAPGIRQSQPHGLWDTQPAFEGNSSIMLSRLSAYTDPVLAALDAVEMTMGMEDFVHERY